MCLGFVLLEVGDPAIAFLTRAPGRSVLEYPALNSDIDTDESADLDDLADCVGRR